ncbi:UV excision repair protein rad23 [Coemansia sp. RSA 1722]|nr:UV excision repair protein rad23 [Coemansia sp. RSA 486]KAJ2229892.1 UV excision repair protein rad23 [Coemansia sp. RSA 485]KAJ2604648.1 UV excision repair protein rad23 [Coemansia sp. RSA 1722]
MKISLKTLQQKTFQLEVEPSDTIEVVKQKVEKEQGFPASTQKLIFSGKILTNEQTVEEIKITENDFMVVMTVKAKPTASKPKPEVNATPASNSSKPAASVAAPAAQRTAAAVATEEPTTPSPAARVLPSTEPASGSGQQAVGEQGLGLGNSFIAGEQYETAIANMVEMGYSREQCVKAMRASFNNPDRAVEYLIMGIPEAALRMADEAEARNANQQQQQQQQQQSGDQQADAGDAGSDRSSAPAARTGNQASGGNLFHEASQLSQQQQQQQSMGDDLQVLETLRTTPQFRQLQQLLREDPRMLPQVMAELARQQPQLMEVISRNNEEFMVMLLQGFSEEQMTNILNQTEAMGFTGMDDDDDMGEEHQQGVTQIRVTMEEKEAIERLQALGFPRDVVIQAYFACDKNEELTANYLFDHGYEDME